MGDEEVKKEKRKKSSHHSSDRSERKKSSSSKSKKRRAPKAAALPPIPGTDELDRTFEQLLVRCLFRSILGRLRTRARGCCTKVTDVG